MAKKYYEGTDYSFNTNWGGDESTGNLPLSGGAVQDVIKQKVSEIENNLGKKVGYIQEDKQQGIVYFCATQEDYENGVYMGQVTSTARYSMLVMQDEGNKTMFLSNDSKKEYVWYFKTLEIATKQAFVENVSVEYIVKNLTEGTEKMYSTIIDCSQDAKNDNYTKVVMNLDEYLTNGTSQISISVKGLTTKQTNALAPKITIITLDVKDDTDFSKSVSNNFIATTNIKCTLNQEYFYEYRVNEQGNFIYDSTTYKGKGSEEVINYTVNVSNLPNGRHTFEYRIGLTISGEIEPYYTPIHRIEFIKGEDVEFTEPQILFYSSYNSNESSKNESGDLLINGVSQYIPCTIKYAVYNSVESSTKVEFYEIINGQEGLPTTDTVVNNRLSEYNIQIMESGSKYINVICKNSNNVIINGEGRKIQLEVEESTLDIDLYDTNLRVDFSSVGKSNNSSDKDTWVSVVGKNFINRATFNKDYDWSQGWTENGLVVSEGCEVKFDYTPFPQQKDDASTEESNEYVGGRKAYTFEIEFMTQNVTDENAVVCDMMDETEGGKCGLQITGSEFRFTTPGGESVSTRFKAEEMNRATIIIRPRTTSSGAFKGLVELYINGSISSVAKYTEDEKFEVFGKDSVGNSISKNLTFKGAAGADIVIKYIRTYNGAMEGDDVVNNYIIYRTDSKEMLNLYNKNSVINEEGTITPDSMLKVGNIPILIFVGRTNEKELATGDGNKGDGKGNCDEEYIPGSIGANEENWYQTLENTTDKKKNIDMDVIYYNPLDKSKNFKFIKAYITPQGTSSMYYPKKNYRLYTQKNKDTRCFFSNETAGVLELDAMMRWDFGEREEDRVFEKWRGKDNYKKRKYAFKDNSQAVKCWTLKADFAETSSSHNTGVARLWGDTLKNSMVEINKEQIPVFKTNAQATTESNYNNDKENMPDIRTTVDGFPIVVFGKKSYSSELVFLGKYNFNNDKSTESVFGFCDIDDKVKLIDQGQNTLTGEKSEVEHTLDNMLDTYMTCVETLDNGNALANFSTMDDFDEKWEDAFEFRYMEIPEKPKEKDYKDENGNWKDYEGYLKDTEKYKKEKVEWDNTRLKPFKHFAQWVYDTRWCDVDGNILPGLTEEEAMRRKEKFATEKWNHLDVWKMAAYYIYAMRFGAVDQIVKNSMLTSEGPFARDKDGNKGGYWDTTPQDAPEYGQFYKWYYINYDNDTVLGVKNDGSLAYGPEITRRMKEGEGATASYIYAGSQSTLWNNFDQDEEFQDIIRIADQGISKTMTYKKAIEMFDVEQVGKWCERIYNKDAEYKYLSPYFVDWKYDGADENVEAFVDKLFMLQGSRTAHRRWWMSKRFSLFDGKWNSGEFATKYVEVKCDYGSIDDTFSAVAGANAYFGYQINNKTFGDGAKDGGATTEYNANERIDWKLYKNIQIGDPIAIYGSTDMLELNLSGLSKNLSSVVFNFGSNADIKNKLERLIISVPDELLFTNASYEIYSDDAEGTVNWKSGFDKLKLEYPELMVSDFEEGGKYPTSENTIDATDPNSPMFYRTPVENEDGDIVYIYFSKVTGGIRNYSCQGISFDALDKLQVLEMAGYMNVPNINLVNNKFLNSVDVRYSNISKVSFAEGTRIKEFKASSALTELSFTRCNNIKLNKIMIDSVSLRENGGKNLNVINIDNSEGLNHDNEFKTFILKWIAGGKGFKKNSDRTLSLRGVNWTNITIDNIKSILEFAVGDSFTGANKSKGCTITGTIEMAQQNLSREDIATIEKLKSTKGIDLIVKIAFANIFIDGPETIVAGDPNAVFTAQIYPDDIKLGTTKIGFKVTPKDSTNPRIIGWRWKEDSTPYDGQLTQMYLTSEETTQDSVEVEVTAMLVSEGGSDETNTKQISMDTLVMKPTYPSINKSTIEGNITIKLGNTYTFVVNNIDENGKVSTGSYDVKWSCNGEGVEFVNTETVGNDFKITVIKDILDMNNPAAAINLTAIVTPLNGEAFTINSKTQVLSSNAVISRATHPEIMNALENVMGWSDDVFAMSRAEAATFSNAQLAELNNYLVGMKHTSSSTSKISFNEFAEFTGITELPNNFFANSDLSEISLPKSLTNLGKVNGYNGYTSDISQGTGLFSGCTKLTKITFPNNTFFNSESTVNGNIVSGVVIANNFCYGCSSLSEITLPKGVVYIGDYSFGGTNIKSMVIPSATRKLGKLFITDDTGSNSVIEEITVPALCTTLDYRMFQADSLKGIKIDESYVDRTTGEIYINPYYRVDNYGCLIAWNNVSGDELVRMPSLNEVYDEDDNLITEFDFSSSLFSYNIIGVDAFRNVKNLTKVTLNTAKWSTQAGIKIYSNIGGYGALVDSGSNYNALFENCPNLTEVIINGDWMEGGIVPDRCFANATNLEKVQLVSGFEYIGEYAYYNNAITEIIMPDTIKAVAMKFVDKCNKLENIVFSKIITSLSGISYNNTLISGLSSLRTITLPYLIELLPISFVHDCSMLEEFVLPNGYASYGRDINGNHIIVLHSDEYEMITYLEQNPDFKQCNDYVVENGVIYKSNLTTIVKAPFAIENIELPETITNISNYAFYECSKLTSIELPNNNITFGEVCFGNSGLLELVVPDNVTTIGARAFESILNLRKIVFGKNVRNLSNGILGNCSVVSEITFKSEIAPSTIVNTFAADGRRPGFSIKETKIMYVPFNNSGYEGENWNRILVEANNWYPFIKTPINMTTYGMRKSAMYVTLYNNGEKFTAQEMYLIHTATGNKIVGIKNGDRYVIPELSKLYIDEQYAVMISLDGLSYTFGELITIEYDKFDYEVDSVNGMNPYHDASAVMSMSLDDEMGVGVSSPQTVSKYEYDVLAARIAYLESLLK